MQDALGDSMKLYEMEQAGRKLMLGLPILARIDGRAFHTFTRGLATFSTGLCTNEVFFWLESHAKIQYKQGLKDQIVFKTFSKAQIKTLFLNESFYLHINADLLSIDLKEMRRQMGRKPFWTLGFESQFELIPAL